MGKKKRTSPAVKATATKEDRATAAAEASTPATPSTQNAPAAPTAPLRRPVSFNFAGVGRNDICPCGSGKRFKNCHGH
ncbi:MAG TPA: SEC-C metal-binding domain-containing protein [Candidatus Dormibacteraeota bacterium]|nr:SEC-C metal-binding domain-containing protein [Candidatus Dormibacteraeota bacterium]